MSDELTAWLRAEIDGDYGRARDLLDRRGAWPEPRCEMHDAIADCEAKLAILDEHWHAVNGFGRPIDKCRTCGTAYPCRTVRLVGRGYRYRPGYKEEWRA